MQDFVSGLPKIDALKRGLASALQCEDVGGRSLTLLGREPTPYATTFPCEILRRLHGFGNGPTLALFGIPGWQSAGREAERPRGDGADSPMDWPVPCDQSAPPEQRTPPLPEKILQ